ncbi:MAG: T9SS type A sorting domain-containing protein [Bacteroidota bacterium]
MTDRPNGIPKVFGLGQNYPNPFNPTTNIIYDIPAQSHVTLTLVDLMGREVARVVDAVQPAGRYKAVFDASGLASGVYLYRIQAGTFVQSRKCMVVK